MSEMEQDVGDSGKVEVDDSDSVRSNYTSINENDNISHYNPRYDANQYPYQGQTFNAKIVIPPEVVAQHQGYPIFLQIPVSIVELNAESITSLDQVPGYVTSAIDKEIRDERNYFDGSKQLPPPQQGDCPIISGYDVNDNLVEQDYNEVMRKLFEHSRTERENSQGMCNAAGYRQDYAQLVEMYNTNPSDWMQGIIKQVIDLLKKAGDEKMVEQEEKQVEQDKKKLKKGDEDEDVGYMSEGGSKKNKVEKKKGRKTKRKMYTKKKKGNSKKHKKKSKVKRNTRRK